MGIISVLIPLALMISGVALWGFRWAIRTGQFEDVETPPLRMVVDQDEHQISKPEE